METTRKVRCSVIYFLMFAKSNFSCNFPVVSVFLSGVSDWPEKMAVIQVIVLVQASHLWVKYLFFSSMMFRWFIMSWSGSVQVYNSFTKDFWGYCVGVFFLKTSEVKTLLSSLIIFFVPLQKNLLLSIIPLSEVSLIICWRLTNTRDSFKI